MQAEYASTRSPLGDVRMPGAARYIHAWIEERALFFTALAVMAAVLIAKAPAHISQDTWLSLVDGRYVLSHGVPGHDPLAVLTRGARWIDQQWLAQLGVYGLDRVGGLALYAIAYVTLSVGAFGMAILAARRFGSSDAHVMCVLPAAGFLFLAGSLHIRTQGLAYPIFVAVLWLLLDARRSPRSRRVYAAFPLLVLWANLHGSAILGVGLASLYGVALVCESARATPASRFAVRGVAFAIGAPLCLLATPYGIAGPQYYAETLMNPTFKSLLAEWQPITASPILAVPFLLTALGSLWLFAHRRGRTGAFETLTLLVLIAAATAALRNVTWFALGATMLTPAALTAVARRSGQASRRPRLNLVLLGAAAAVALVSVTSAATKPDSGFEESYDSRVLARVTAIARHEPRLRVYADLPFSDWLLWHEPHLAGRVAYDARVELLRPAQLRELAHPLARHGTGEGDDLLHGYGLLVLDTSDPGSRLLLARPGARLVMDSNGVAVARYADS